MSKPLPEFLNVPWRPKDALNLFIASWLLVPVVLTLTLRWAASYSQAARSWLQAFMDGNIAASFVFALLASALGIAVAFWYLRKYGATWHDLGLRRFDARKAIVYVVLTIALFLISIPILFAILKLLVPGFNADQVQTNEFVSPTTTTAYQLSFLALVVIPPITEEIIFRGFIFPAFAKRWGVAIGAVLTSLLFGFAHLQANVGVYTIALSLLLCLMYARLRSIIPGIALHMLNNYLAFMAKVNQ